MTLLEKLIDTFRLSHVRVHVPRRILEFRNPSDVCVACAVARVSSGYTELAAGKFVTRNALEERFERIMHVAGGNVTCKGFLQVQTGNNP